MNLFAFLQSIVSIAFIYLVLSLFTSEIQEYLAAIFESRPKRLKQSIRQMLGEQDYPFVPLTVDENIPISNNTASTSSVRIWIDPNGVIKKVKDINNIKKLDKDNSEFIFVKLLEEEKYVEVSQQIDTIQDVLEVSQQIDTIQDVLNSNSHYYYEKGATVIRHSIYTLFQAVEANGNVWENNGRLSVIKPEDIGKIDNQNIWINDNDNSLVNTSEVDQAKIHKGKSETLGTSIPVTQYPVFSNLGTDPISSGTKVWLSQGKINDVSIPKKEHYIYEVDGREVNETEVKQYGAIPDRFYTVGEIVIETRVYEIKEGIKIDNANSYYYYLDIVNRTLVVVDRKNKVIQEQEISDPSQYDSLFDSLTEKIYRHRNIKALNQSGFAWLSLFSLLEPSLSNTRNWAITYYAWLFLISIISIIAVGVLVRVFNIQSIIDLISTFDLRWILGSWLLILLVLSYLLNQSEGDPKTKAPVRNRKSVGPSYIGADTFANTLLDVLRYNTIRGVEDETKRLSTLSYTPAKPVLGRWLKQLQTDKQGADLKSEELVDELRKKYETAFNKVQERSSGVYKRNAKGLSFLIGLLLAILLNADTLNFVNKFTQADNTSLEKIFGSLRQLEISPKCLAEPSADGCPDAQDESFKALREQFATLNKDNALPLGWNTDTPTAQEVNTAIEGQGGWLIVPFGWLITAIAISMGAPFWFDLIGRIVNVRNANKEGNTTGSPGSSTTPGSPPEGEGGGSQG